MTRDELTRMAESLGFSQVGVARAAPSETVHALDDWLAGNRHGEMEWMATRRDLRADPRTLLPTATSVIAVALDYGQPLPKTDGPKIARYALGRDYHRVLRDKLKKLAARIPGETRICVDSAPILEREWAHRAGLGWFGKNTMLIDSRRGSWCYLGILLTEHEFPPDRPALGGCGSCRACIDACPTGAIVHANGRWQIDARRCISYLTIEAEAVPTDTAGWDVGCDVCQEVCPFNAPRDPQPLRGRPATEPDLAPRPWPSRAEIAEWTEAEWDLATRGSAVRRVGYARLKALAAREI